MFTVISRSDQDNLMTLHVDVYEDETCKTLIKSKTKSGMRFSEWRILFHLVAEAILKLETWEGYTHWTDDNLKVQRYGLAVNAAVSQLYKTTLGKTKSIELISEEPRRFIMLDFAHHAQQTFFTGV